ncbi:MAG: AMP-binding protein, partial [Archangium sp.]
MKIQLDYVQEHEAARRDERWFTQPMGGGVIKTFTFGEALSEVRRMAAWLKAQNLEPGSRIAIFSKNTAWWLMADLAIWMAGHVSVPIYPTLNATSIAAILAHSEARLIFVGKLDNYASMEAGLTPSVKRIAMPLAPNVPDATKWNDIIASTRPLEGTITRGEDELATIIYTSGSTG